MKKMILAVMYIIKEIAIMPENFQSLEIFFRLNHNFFNCVHHCEDHLLHLIF